MAGGSGQRWLLLLLLLLVLAVACILASSSLLATCSEILIALRSSISAIWDNCLAAAAALSDRLNALTALLDSRSAWSSASVAAALAADQTPSSAASLAAVLAAASPSSARSKALAAS